MKEIGESIDQSSDKMKALDRSIRTTLVKMHRRNLLKRVGKMRDANMVTRFGPHGKKSCKNLRDQYQ